MFPFMSKPLPPAQSQPAGGLTHFDAPGQAHLVDGGMAL
jgi:hypothetical protein